MSSKTMKYLGAALACATLSFSAAWGQQSVDSFDSAVPQRNVDFKDLNLASEPDAQRLYTRLRGAARDVCVQFSGKSVRERMKMRECVGDALSKAVLEVNHPALTALHASNDTVRVAQRGEAR